MPFFNKPGSTGLNGIMAPAVVDRVYSPHERSITWVWCLKKKQLFVVFRNETTQQYSGFLVMVTGTVYGFESCKSSFDERSGM